MLKAILDKYERNSVIEQLSSLQFICPFSTQIETPGGTPPYKCTDSAMGKWLRIKIRELPGKSDRLHLTHLKFIGNIIHK